VPPHTAAAQAIDIQACARFVTVGALRFPEKTCNTLTAVPTRRADRLVRRQGATVRAALLGFSDRTARSVFSFSAACAASACCTWTQTR
jgi:hypothetical protein